VTSIEIRDHLFGPNFLSSAIEMERVDMALTPSVSISIYDSRFENEGSDYEMVKLSNVQPVDEVLLESDHFVHSFVNISFGESDDDAVTHSLTVRDSNFTSMTSHSAVYLQDIDYDTTTAKQRGVSYFQGNSFRDCDGPSSLIEIELIENNDNVEDDYRVIVDANTFDDNDFVDDLIALRSLNAGTGGAPSLYLVNNSYTNNHVDSLLHCDGGDHIVNLSASTTPLVRATANAFWSGTEDIGLFDVTECELELSASNLIDETLVVSSAVSIVEIFDISAERTKVLYLNDSRKTSFGARIDIYSSHFVDSSDLMEMYLKPSDSVYIYDSDFEQSTMTVRSGTADSFSTSSGEQLDMNNCSFRNHVGDRRAFYLESNGQDWMPNVTLWSSAILNNDNNSQSHNTSLFAIHSNNLNQRAQSIFRVEDTRFENNNGDIWSIEEPDIGGNVTINNLVTFSNVEFIRNEKSVLLHEYGPYGPSTVVTFEDCSWRENEESNDSMSALSSMITVRASADASSVFADDGTAHLVLTRNVFDGNARFADSMIAAYFGIIEMTDSVWTANMDSMLETRQSVVSVDNVTLSDNVGTTRCMLCLLESSALNMVGTRFLRNEGALMESNRSSLVVSNSAVDSHQGSIGRIGIDLEEEILFENCNFTASNSSDSGSLFSIVGSVEELAATRIKFVDTAFEDNTGTILETETDGTDGAPFSFQCPSGESYDDADADGNGGIFEIDTVSFRNNRIHSAESAASHLIQLDHQRIAISSLVFEDNLCRDSVDELELSKIGKFDGELTSDGDGCIVVTDCSISMSSTQFARNNGTFIWSLRRRWQQDQIVEDAPICVSNLNESNDFGNTFMHFVNFTESDVISVSSSIMASPFVNYMFYVFGEEEAEGTYMTIDNSLFERVNSSVLKWNTSLDEYGDYHLNLNVTRSQFTTTALHVELNSLAENHETYIEFRRNVMRNYTDLSAQQFMFYLSTEGAPLLFVLDDNELIDINPEDFYLTAGPVRVQTVNHSSNQDDYADLVDPLHVIIRKHHFGPLYDNLAINVTRVDVEGVPSSTIEIIDSFFEHSFTDQEMCRFYNIQPSDTIIIRGSNFSHAFCSFYFGHQVESDNSTVDTTGSVLIDNCRFEDYS
ncbi:MAG: hypothetical protein MK136_17765, partial [Pirellulaceae bacterium]|nr:hypothetical protein [Pirellulaceae bacterium]